MRTWPSRPIAILGIAFLVGFVSACAATDPPAYTDAGTTTETRVAQSNLVADTAGTAAATDTNLVNPWGLAHSLNGPWWISDNGTGLSTVYDSNGASQNIKVTIPPPPGAMAGTTAAPTGVVFNNAPAQNGTPAFGGDVFIFATEDGTVAGWQMGNAATLRINNAASRFSGSSTSSGGAPTRRRRRPAASSRRASPSAS